MAEDTVADLVLETLAREAGIRTAFGISGGPIVPYYASLANVGISYLQAKSEREAGYMARGHYMNRRRPAVVLATTGANLDVLEPAVGAREAREPFLLLTAVSPPEHAGYGCLQELLDPIGIFHGARVPGKAVYHPENVLHSVREALQALLWHRLPFVLALPKEILMAPRPKRHWDSDGFLPDPGGAVDRSRVESYALALLSAKRPLLVLGREAVFTAEDQAQICALATRFRIPVATTQRGRGAVPERGFAWSVGGVGSGSSPVAQHLMFDAESPVTGLFIVGSQLGQLATNSFRELAGGSAGINVIADDPKVLCKYSINQGIIVRDPSMALRVLAKTCLDLPATERGESVWTTDELAGFTTRFGASHDPPTSEIAQMLGALSDVLQPGVKWFIGSGEHNLHFTQHVRMTTARGYNYEPFGMMGADLPSAIGYAVAQSVEGGAVPCQDASDARFQYRAGRGPRELIAVVTGDGCLSRSLGSLMTLAETQLPIFVLVLNNGGAGQVRWVHQHLHPGRPDVYDVPFTALADVGRAVGVHSLVADSPAALVDAWRSFEASPRPVLCEVRLGREDHPHKAMQVRRRVTVAPKAS